MQAPRKILAAPPADARAAGVEARARLLARHWSSTLETATCGPDDLLAEIGRSRPDIVVTATASHSLAERLGLVESDWQLIRQCTCPLLLVRGQEAPDWRVILAALDPLHAHAKPAVLDEQLLAAASLVGAAAGGHVHALHAHALGVNVPLAAPGAAVSTVFHGGRNPAVLHRDALEAIARAHGLPTGRIHFETGDPRDVIPAIARRLGAGLVVMGAVSRNPVRRLLTGSTAEAVLDRLDGDVLLLHPA